MPHNALHTLLRLRQAALDDARRAVGETIAAEAAALAARNAAEAAITAETRIATQSHEDRDVERFARWLKRGRARLNSAEVALAEATAATTVKRAELNLARAATEAVSNAIALAQEEDRRRSDRAEQRALDEVKPAALLPNSAATTGPQTR